ncbi:MAG TPA: hypothetical protein VJ227_00785 [Patescibacteria group bacterium]|nr:hypothetical protein [Patescibacteria group bacterium]
MNSWEIAAYGVEVAANGNLELGALNGQAATFAAVQAVVFAVLAVAAAILSSRTGERM